MFTQSLLDLDYSLSWLLMMQRGTPKHKCMQSPFTLLQAAACNTLISEYVWCSYKQWLLRFWFLFSLARDFAQKQARWEEELQKESGRVQKHCDEKISMSQNTSYWQLQNLLLLKSPLHQSLWISSSRGFSCVLQWSLFVPWSSPQPNLLLILLFF